MRLLRLRDHGTDAGLRFEDHTRGWLKSVDQPSPSCRRDIAGRVGRGMSNHVRSILGELVPLEIAEDRLEIDTPNLTRLGPTYPFATSDS